MNTPNKNISNYRPSSRGQSRGGKGGYNGSYYKTDQRTELNKDNTNNSTNSSIYYKHNSNYNNKNDNYNTNNYFKKNYKDSSIKYSINNNYNKNYNDNDNKSLVQNNQDKKIEEEPRKTLADLLNRSSLNKSANTSVNQGPKLTESAPQVKKVTFKSKKVNIDYDRLPDLNSSTLSKPFNETKDVFGDISMLSENNRTFNIENDRSILSVENFDINKTMELENSNLNFNLNGKCQEYRDNYRVDKTSRKNSVNLDNNEKMIDISMNMTQDEINLNMNIVENEDEKEADLVYSENNIYNDPISNNEMKILEDIKEEQNLKGQNELSNINQGSQPTKKIEETENVISSDINDQHLNHKYEAEKQNETHAEAELNKPTTEENLREINSNFKSGRKEKYNKITKLQVEIKEKQKEEEGQMPLEDPKISEEIEDQTELQVELREDQKEEEGQSPLEAPKISEEIEDQTELQAELRVEQKEEEGQSPLEAPKISEEIEDQMELQAELREDQKEEEGQSPLVDYKTSEEIEIKTELQAELREEQKEKEKQLPLENPKISEEIANQTELQAELREEQKEKEKQLPLEDHKCSEEKENQTELQAELREEQKEEEGQLPLEDHKTSEEKENQTKLQVELREDRKEEEGQLPLEDPKISEEIETHNDINPDRGSEQEDLQKEKEKISERKNSQNFTSTPQSNKKLKHKRTLKRSSAVNPEEEKVFSDYFKNLFEDPTVNIAEVISNELGSIKNTINSIFRSGKLDAALIGYQRGYDQYKLIMKTTKKYLDSMPEEKRTNYLNTLPSIKKMGRDFLKNTSTILLKMDNYNECIENDLMIFERESKDIGKVIMRLIICHMLTDQFDCSAYFLLKFYHNVLTLNKDKEGCENFLILISDQRVTSILNTLNITLTNTLNFQSSDDILSTITELLISLKKKNKLTLEIPEHLNKFEYEDSLEFDNFIIAKYDEIKNMPLIDKNDEGSNDIETIKVQKSFYETVKTKEDISSCFINTSKDENIIKEKVGDEEEKIKNDELMKEKHNKHQTNSNNNNNLIWIIGAGLTGVLGMGLFYLLSKKKF